MTSQRVLLGFAIAAILAGPIGMAALGDFESDGPLFNDMVGHHNQMAPMHNGMNHGDGIGYFDRAHREGSMGGIRAGF